MASRHRAVLALPRRRTRRSGCGWRTWEKVWITRGPLRDYAQAARHLGQFNGTYLAGEPLPNASWLSHDWLRKWVARAPGVEHLAAVAHHARIQRLCPPDVQAGYRQLWDRREALFSQLDRLPRTLCHMDAFYRNLHLRTGQDGTRQTVAFDWAYVGVDAVGADLASLVWANATILERVALAKIRAVFDAVLEGYFDGLCDVGWADDADLIRFSFAATSLLRYGIGLAVPRWHQFGD